MPVVNKLEEFNYPTNSLSNLVGSLFLGFCILYLLVYIKVAKSYAVINLIGIFQWMIEQVLPTKNTIFMKFLTQNVVTPMTYTYIETIRS